MPQHCLGWGVPQVCCLPAAVCTQGIDTRVRFAGVGQACHNLAQMTIRGEGVDCQPRVGVCCYPPQPTSHQAHGLSCRHKAAGHGMSVNAPWPKLFRGGGHASRGARPPACSRVLGAGLCAGTRALMHGAGHYAREYQFEPSAGFAPRAGVDTARLRGRRLGRMPLPRRLVVQRAPCRHPALALSRACIASRAYWLTAGSLGSSDARNGLGCGH